MGPIIVAAKGAAHEDGRAKDVDRDIVTMYMVGAAC